MSTPPEDMVMPFGAYEGWTLGRIAEADLLYIDWLNGLNLRNRKLTLAITDMCNRFSHEIDSLLAATE